VDGWLLLVSAVPAAVFELLPELLLAGLLPEVLPNPVSGRADAPIAPATPVGLPSAAMAARSVVASCTASAFFRCTTCTLPLALAELGWSSFSTSERTSASRAALAARTISALLRGSARMDVL